jgi:acetyl-CoA carboxylase biotin carboxyl carrier protein
MSRSETESSASFALDELRALAQLMQDFSLGELELVRASGDSVRLARGGSLVSMPAPAVMASAAAPAPIAAATTAPAASPPPANVHAITAPLVGTFYRSPSPDAPFFTEVGQRVRKGQTLCIIEAMKLMNELECEVDGVVVAVLADNGRPVEFGQPLFHIQKG